LATKLPPRRYCGQWVNNKKGETTMSLGTILIIILILVLLGAIPAWPHSRGWGYGPGGIVGLILIIVIVLALMGRI
jgi:sterol desaturase/sphingolipid hydroxylase (fatty acid hydroxylase superfamily)